MDVDHLRIQHFSLLKEKFCATDYPDMAPNSLLYLILRKADLNIVISESEENWLKKNSLDQTLTKIHLAQYQAQESQRLEAELIQLQQQYGILSPHNLSSPNPLDKILWQLEHENRVTDDDIQWLYTNQLDKQASLAEAITEFASLKQKYGAECFTPFHPDGDLYPILKKLHAKEPLAAGEAEWLLDAGLLDTFEIFEQQEKERQWQAEFLALKSKYGLENYPENTASSFLFIVLQRINADRSLDIGEINWLKQENLLNLIKIDQNLKNRQLLEQLKAKYRVKESEHVAFSEKLFKLLQAIDAKEYLSDRDVKWLEDQGLNETAVFAHVIRFLRLKAKYRLVDPNLPFQPFYNIMIQIEREKRLNRKQIAQLIHEGYLWRDGMIAKAYHRLEAQFYVQELQRTGNKWNIPSAVSDWRKAGECDKALQLSEHLKLKQIPDNKLKAAILTTRGQTLRDIGRLEEAKFCAQTSVDLQPDDHRPYTLMATILDRMQSYESQEWWAEAIARGADPGEQDYEMKRLVRNSKNSQERDKLVRFLLKKDPRRYVWAKEYLRD